MFFCPQRLHFTGIGGIGMSGIAEVLLSLGYSISGSDLKRSPITARLESLGASVAEGHAAANIAGAKVLVISSAVDERNPEVVEARRQGIPVIPRGELLAELMRLKYGIAVAGSHGKTTTTSMAATILDQLGLDPTVIVGGRLSTIGGTNARVGKSDLLVVESDESDGSFLKLAPIVAVVTNIDHEHLDHYKDFAAIRRAFAEFINKVPFYGVAVLCLDDPNVRSLLPEVRRRAVTYGRTAQADIEIPSIRREAFLSRFTLRTRDRDLGEFTLNVPGEHNVLNATAAIAVALELGQEPDRIRTALEAFRGVDRRFQIRGQAAGVTVVDDYGHHPTEIRATLETARGCGYRKIHVLFQPHRYTRTHLLMDEFAGAFHQADHVYLTEIYAASEPPMEGVTGAALAERMRAFGHRSVEFVGTLPAGIEAVTANVREGDLVVTLGAGSISQAGDLILSTLLNRARSVPGPPTPSDPRPTTPSEPRPSGSGGATADPRPPTPSEPRPEGSGPASPPEPRSTTPSEPRPEGSGPAFPSAPPSEPRPSGSGGATADPRPTTPSEPRPEGSGPAFASAPRPSGSGGATADPRPTTPSEPRPEGSGPAFASAPRPSGSGGASGSSAKPSDPTALSVLQRSPTSRTAVTSAATHRRPPGAIS